MSKKELSVGKKFDASSAPDPANIYSQPDPVLARAIARFGDVNTAYRQAMRLLDAAMDAETTGGCLAVVEAKESSLELDVVDLMTLPPRKGASPAGPTAEDRQRAVLAWREKPHGIS